MKSKREQEEDKKKADEAAAAKVYEDFYNTFVNVADQKNKVWVKAGTFDAGSRKEDTKDKGKLYKPTSRLEELREKFSTPDSTSPQHGNKSDRPDKPGKKKEKDKKKSNLELFKEELKLMQEERAERHRIKSGFRETPRPTRFENAEPKPLIKDIPKAEDLKTAGSYDTGDPTTTNIYLGNLNPQTTEQRLMELFGRFGPLASVKIMWPRTDDERSRGRNCGFVAFMNRKDGERCITTLNGKEVDNFEMKLGWGKCVPIPPHPIYIPPSLMELTLPPPPSLLPFNCQPIRDDRVKLSLLNDMEKQNQHGTAAEMEKILQRAIVKVVIPTERELLHLIHRMIEFVIREGPMFEAMIMNREMNNPHFRFLFDNQSPAHVYYRWKLYSILQGDAQGVWKLKPFRMFAHGSVWKPPPINPYHQGMPPELVKREEVKFDAEFNKKGSLSEAQRKRLESMIRRMTPEKEKIGEAMVWCIEHAEAAYEICQCLAEALSNPDTPMPKKIARLYLISDILHNCSIKVTNASFFRKYLEERLAEIFQWLRESYESVESRLKAEQVKQRIMKCIRVWEDWAVYPPEFLIKLQNTFLGLDKKRNSESDTPNSHEEPLDEYAPAMPEPKEDVDGIPLDDVDGFPLQSANFGSSLKNGAAAAAAAAAVSNSPLSVLVKKTHGISALAGYGDDEDSQDEDIDGAPLDDDIDGAPLNTSPNSKSAPGFVPSKWETVSPKRVEEEAMTLSKWDEMEANRKRHEEQDNEEDGGASDSTPVYDNPASPASPVDADTAMKYDVADQDDIDGTPLEDSYNSDHRRPSHSSDEEGAAPDGVESEEEENNGSPQQEEDYEDEYQNDRNYGDTEERRAKLRAVEIKVLKYQDELERGRREVKHGYTLLEQVKHYRHKLIKKVTRDTRSSSERRSRRRRSSSPEIRKSSKKSRSPHRSQHRGRSRSPRRHKSRSPKRRRPSHSRSPSRKHKKKRR